MAFEFDTGFYIQYTIRYFTDTPLKADISIILNGGQG
jgi:hypothetical protein